mmetsp:Transcript_41855/g.98053  ORF Transcript_41855/g.98053 Transcript_41855/m.98053 type:complete len:230 (-) Transcript_41855:2558-3247(-)
MLCFTGLLHAFRSLRREYSTRHLPAAARRQDSGRRQHPISIDDNAPNERFAQCASRCVKLENGAQRTAHQRHQHEQVGAWQCGVGGNQLTNRLGQRGRRHRADGQHRSQSLRHSSHVRQHEHPWSCREHHRACLVGRRAQKRAKSDAASTTQTGPTTQASTGTSADGARRLGAAMLGAALPRRAAANEPSARSAPSRPARRNGPHRAASFIVPQQRRSGKHSSARAARE